VTVAAGAGEELAPDAGAHVLFEPSALVRASGTGPRRRGQLLHRDRGLSGRASVTGCHPAAMRKGHARKRSQSRSYSADFPRYSFCRLAEGAGAYRRTGSWK
jgi:hypothetical protein